MRCEADLERTLRGKAGSKRELLAEDRVAVLDLPGQSFDARRVSQAAACGLSLVRFDTNRYSVPVAHARRPITIVASVDTVRLAACLQGRRVRFFRVTELITTLLEARDEKTLLRLRS